MIRTGEFQASAKSRDFIALLKAYFSATKPLDAHVHRALSVSNLGDSQSLSEVYE